MRLLNISVLLGKLTAFWRAELAIFFFFEETVLRYSENRLSYIGHSDTLWTPLPDLLKETLSPTDFGSWCIAIQTYRFTVSQQNAFLSCASCTTAVFSVVFGGSTNPRPPEAAPMRLHNWLVLTSLCDTERPASPVLLHVDSNLQVDNYVAPVAPRKD